MGSFVNESGPMDAMHASDSDFPSSGLIHSQRHTVFEAGSYGSMFRLKKSNPNSQVSMLPRCLTFWHLVPLGVGSTIGAGIYVLIGTAARERTGPALPLSFIIAGTAAGMAALCYAELASRCPSAGSAYHYAYTTVGEIVAWLIGWALILEYTVGGSAVARGISPNLAVLYGGVEHLPSFLSRIPCPPLHLILDPTAAAVSLAVTALLCMGIKESATFQAAMTVANVAVLLVVVGAGSYAGIKSGWPGYQQPGGYLPYGVNGLLGGAAMVFFSYVGFDAVASTAEEVKHPQRDLPLGIGLSLIACGSLYVAVAAVLVGMIPTSEFNIDTPIAQAFHTHDMAWAMYFVACGALAALTTTLLGSLLPQPRILMAMGRDGLLPRWFCRVHSASGVPVNATLATGSAAALLAFFMDIDQLSGMVSVGTLMAFSVVSLAVLILRYCPPKETLPPPPSVQAGHPHPD